MASGEIASAYLSIYPKLEGKAVVNEVTKTMSGAGKSGGQSFSKGASSAMSTGMAGAGSSGASALAQGFSAASVAIGSIAADVAMSAAAEFQEKFAEGVAQSDALQKFASTMEFAGFDTGQIEAVQGAMKDYADQTVYDLDEVMQTTAKLAANGVTDFDTLVQSIGNLNAAAGGDATSFGYLANAITQVNGSGKLMSQDWNQIVNALPGASGAIQNELKEMGAWDESMGSFKDAMADGQISSEEFNTAIQNLGMTDIAQEAATSTTTFEGAMGQLDASMTNTMQSIYDSINGDGRITGAINSMASAFDVVGPAIGQFVGVAADALAEFGATIMPSLQTAFETVAPALENFGSTLLPVLASAFQTVGGIVMSILPAVIPLLATAFSTVLNVASGVIAAVEPVITVLERVFTYIVQGIAGIVIPYQTMMLDIFNMVWPAIQAVVSAVASFIATDIEARFTFIKTVIDTVLNAVKVVITTVWNAIRTKISTVVGNIKSTITTGFNAIKTFLGSVFSGIKEKLTKPFRDAKNAIKGVIDGIKSFFPFNIGNILNLKLPHISVSGGKAPWGIAGKGSLPSFHVNWYAQGGIFNAPSIIGVGEAGSEAVVPLEKLRYYIRDSVPQTAGTELVEEVRALRSDVQNVRLYLDSGALVGGISKRMDGSLGRRQQLAGRGVA